MRSIKKIISESIETQEIKGLVEVYEEIAASKMQEIREGILTSRDFFERLATLSEEIGADLASASMTKKGDVSVFISGSEGLSGDLTDKIFVSFMEYVKKNPKVEKIIIGKLGNEMMQSLAGTLKYKYYEIESPELFSELIKYKKINVFYGKFKSIVTQETWTQTISGQVLEDIQNDYAEEQKFLYVYEPDIKNISKVFSEEISKLVFNGILNESKLAQYASRLMHLDEAIENINKNLNNLSWERLKAIKRNNERKQLSGFAGIINA